MCNYQGCIANIWLAETEETDIKKLLSYKGGQVSAIKIRNTSIFESRSKLDKPRYFAHAPGLQKHPVYTRKHAKVIKN